MKAKTDGKKIMGKNIFLPPIFLPFLLFAVPAIFGGYLFEREWEPEWHRVATNEGPNDERRTKNSGQECPITN